MKKLYTISLTVLVLVVMSGCGTTVIELQPSTAEIVQDRVDFRRLRYSGSDDDDQNSYSSQVLVFPAVVIDLREKIAANPAHTINVNDLLAWEEQYGKIPRGSIVLLHTGWKKEWESPDLYTGGEFHFPTCDGSVTPFLIQERRVAGVGIDREHHFTSEDCDEVEELLARWVDESEGIVLENLTNFDQLPPVGINLQVGILYRGGTFESSIVSVKAFLPKA